MLIKGFGAPKVAKGGIHQLIREKWHFFIWWGQRYGPRDDNICNREHGGLDISEDLQDDLQNTTIEFTFLNMVPIIFNWMTIKA